MKLYIKDDDFTLYEGSMLDLLEFIAPCSVDSVVTDPPYGLTTITKRFGKENSAPAQYGSDGSFSRLSRGFMGKEWDGSGIETRPDTWRKCYEVLKPGGYLLAFGGSRTYHRIACAIEDAGFEIRDCIMWLYGSGFPKSMNIGLMLDKKNGTDSPIVGYTDQLDITGGNWCNNQGERVLHPVRQPQNEWAGWGTALKPAYEPVIVARKPCEGSVLENVIQHRTGGLNIDECRIGEGSGDIKTVKYPDIRGDLDYNCHREYRQAESVEYAVEDKGRYPSNVILTYDKTDEAEVCGGMPDTKSSGGQYSIPTFGGGSDGVCYFKSKGSARIQTDNYYPGDEGSAARYYYCAKASARDRDEGLDEFKAADGGVYEFRQDGSLDGSVPSRRNIHPTVKPVDLMQYLVRLVTPKGGTVLDPFNGSGSTGKAVMFENRDRGANYKYIGIELTPEYLPIAAARIKWAKTYHPTAEKADKPIEGQISIFDLQEGGNE